MYNGLVKEQEAVLPVVLFKETVRGRAIVNMCNRRSCLYITTAFVEINDGIVKEQKTKN